MVVGQAFPGTLLQMQEKVQLRGSRGLESESDVVGAFGRVAVHGLEECVAFFQGEDFIQIVRGENLRGIGHAVLLLSVSPCPMRGGQLRSRTGLAPGEKEMQDKIDDLEISVFYLQKTVDDLNAVIIEQQKELRYSDRKSVV